VLLPLVTAYGVGAAGAGLLQARRLLEARSSCDVSALFFAGYAGGYAIWLVYGVSIGSLPLVVVDAVGVVCATLTLAIALSLRGSLLNPVTWRNCPPATRGHARASC
jgi:MtN3 and saliva related transmembrane protein